MSATILDGKALSLKIREELKKEVEEISKNGRTPGLAVVIVGDDPASRKYVNNKNRACREIGMVSREYVLSADTDEAELLELVEKLNNDPEIDGILVQLPLPRGIDERKIIDAISPDKDVDAFHPENVGKIMIGGGTFLPCTPAGIMELIKLTGIDVCGKECVVVGRSNIVGKPMSLLLLRENGTVTVCHSKTQDMKEITRQADILVVAIGKPKFVDETYVKEGAVVIDVGIHRDAQNKLCGDVDFEKVAPHTSAITPVPGGVGPMTIAMLMNNCVSSVE